MSDVLLEPIQHKLTLNPVTALAFHQPLPGPLLLLVGEGHYIKVYNTETSELLANCRVFKTQTIHGIIVDDTKYDGQISEQRLALVVWGGRSSVCLSQPQLQALVQGSITAIPAKAETAPDWILDVALNPFSDTRCLFITAHNAALQVTYRGHSLPPQVESLVPSSQAILYSAHAVWESSNSFMVAGGSVFGEITVHCWKDGVHTLLCALTGHEGSIFGVHISLPVYNPQGLQIRLLASCSDDRTIRLWSLAKDGIMSEKGSGGSIELDGSKETGFGSNVQKLGSERTERLIAVVMGHGSRIWGVRIVLGERKAADSADAVNIISFGEDATCQQWSLSSWDSNKMAGAMLNHLDTFLYHTGKHIWASAVLGEPRSKSSRIATGGADGSVVVYDVHHHVETENNASTKVIAKEYGLASTLRTKIWTFKEVLGDPPPDEIVDSPPNARVEVAVDASESVASDNIKPALDSIIQALNTTESAIPKPVKVKKPPNPQEDSMNRYAYLSGEELLATTKFGKVMRLPVGQSSHGWKELPLSPSESLDLRFYSLLIGIPELGIAFLMGTNGVLFQYHDGKFMEIVQVEGKPAALLHVTSSDELGLQLLITTLGSNVVMLLSFNTSPTIVYKQKMALQLPEKFVVTSAGNVNGATILGSRNGSIAVYNRSQGGNECIATLQAQPQPKADSVTSIVPIPQFDQSSYQSYFIATSRNGTYSIVSLTNKAFVEDQLGTVPSTTLKLVHQSSPPLSVIEHAWFDRGKLFLYGFQSRSFIVWNETEHCEITNIYCGGAHRSYSYLPTPGAGGAGVFAYTKASTFYLHTQTTPSHQVIKSGSHGREIKASSIMSRGDRNLIATGSEDTNIQILQYQEGSKDQSSISNSLRCLAIIEHHSSGIQALKWDESYEDEDTNFLFSAGGNEEFNIWRVTSIPAFGVGIVLESSLPEHYQTPDHDLRITDFVFKRFLPPARKEGAPKTITWRFTLIYSDSTIRSFLYEASKGWILVAEGRYAASCLTHVLETRMGQKVDKLLTASTDGHVAVWKLPALPFHVSQAQEWPSSFGVFDINTSKYGPPFTTEIPKIILVKRIKLHQSNISAMVAMDIGKGCLLATGGDDNALSLSYLVDMEVTTPSGAISPTIKPSSNILPAPVFYPINAYREVEPIIQSRIVIASAHASTITELAFNGDVTGGEREDQYVRLWSTSSDQSLKRWTIEVNKPSSLPFDYSAVPIGYSVRVPEYPLKLRVRELDVDGLGLDGGRAVTSVPDTAGLVPFFQGWQGSRVFVFGAGMQVFGVGFGFPPVERDIAWD